MNLRHKKNSSIDHYKNIILTVGFMVVLILPSIQHFYTIIPASESNENRSLAEIPKLDLNYLDPFPSQYDSYFNDHFSLRNQILAWHATINFKYFNKSPLPEKVFFGKKDWLFLMKDEFEEYRRTNQFSTEDMEKIVNEMVYRKKYLDDKNISLLFVIAPIKYNIYPEYLPTGLNYFNKPSRSHEVRDALIQNGINTLDLTNMLIQEKSDELLYYKTDNHWNKLGGFYASRAIIDEIRQEYPQVPKLELENYTISKKTIDGKNLAQMIGLRENFEDISYSLVPDTSKAVKAPKANYTVPQWFSYPKEYELVFTTSNNSLPSMLFIRDSFGNAAMPYLSECFDRSVFIFDRWNYTSNEHIIENENPDIVVYMVLEGFWDGFLKGVDISQDKRKSK